jgi:hypothetical protein
VVDVASEYQVFLFVGHDADVQRAFPGFHLFSRGFSEEVLCVLAQTESGVRCETVTTGVYLTQTELNTPADLEFAIMRGLDLVEKPGNLPRNPNISIAPGRTSSPNAGFNHNTG